MLHTSFSGRQSFDFPIPPLALLLAIAFHLLPTAVAAAGAPAGRLPMRAFTVLDGLADDGINHIFPDSRGYLWVSTNSGVSRFDGTRFVSDLEGFGPAWQSAEGKDGSVWIAANSGLYRLDPAAPAGPGIFEKVMPGRFEAVSIDASGNIWAGARDRLYRLRPGAGGREVEEERIEAPFATAASREIRRIVEDGRGRLWLGTHWGLVCRLPDGRQVHYEPLTGPDDRIFDLALDARGRVWTVSMELRVFVPPDDPPPFEPGSRISRVRGHWARALAATPRPAADGRLDLPDEPGEARIYGAKQGLAGTRALLADSRGRIIVGTLEGLDVLDLGDRRLVAYGPENGMPRAVQAIVEDHSGDLWIGTSINGLRRWSRRGFVAYGRGDGLPSEYVAAVFQLQDGRVAVATRPRLEISLLEGDRVRRTGVRLPDDVRNLGWGWAQIVSQDRAGNLWLASEDGVVRLPRDALDLRGAIAGRLFDPRDGLGSPRVFRIFVDSQDELWICTFPDPELPSSVLSRMRLSDGAVRAYSISDGIPSGPTAVAESPEGALWFGMYTGGLVRLDRGKVRVFGEADGVPPSFVSGLFFESRDVLWAATEGGGLLRVSVGADSISVRQYTKADGLSNDFVTAVAGDGRGTLWIGTPRGIDRFVAATGRVESFSTADGLPAGYVLHLLIDLTGRLWVATRGGLARFEPGEDRPAQIQGAPLITDVEVDGERMRLPALGSREVGPIALSPGGGRLRIAFAAVTRGRTLPSFEYRLAGLEETWSRPSTHHEVNLAGLPPGDYRFEVRLARVSSPDAAVPAAVRLSVPVPLWRRPWFLALGITLLAAAAWSIHRARLRRLLALERQRTRIAMDLHDEIGSGLGSIGLMADLAGSDEMDDPARRGMAGQIGDVASSLGTSLAELVGTLRPGGATLEALAKQLSQRGRALFPGGATEFSTSFPDVWPARALDLAVRRDVFLIGAEALHNAARHAGASSVRLSLGQHGALWRLAVEDDGRGLPEEAAGGNGLGLESMRARARRIGAELRVERAEGGGTRVSITFDPRRSARAAG